MKGVGKVKEMVKGLYVLREALDKRHSIGMDRLKIGFDEVNDISLKVSDVMRVYYSVDRNRYYVVSWLNPNDTREIFLGWKRIEEVLVCYSQVMEFDKPCVALPECEWMDMMGVDGVSRELVEDAYERVEAILEMYKNEYDDNK